MLRPLVLPVLYHQDLVRSQVFWQRNKLGEVWSGDLHLFNFFQVRNTLRPFTGTRELLSDRFARLDLLGQMTIHTTTVLPHGRRCC